MISADGLGPEEERLRDLLQLVADHPWAGSGFFQVRAGWSRYHLERAIRDACQRGLIELTRVPARIRKPPLRLGLTWAGADLAGRGLNTEQARLNLLRVLRLDPARLVLAKIQAARPILWSVSPYAVPLKAILPVSEAPKKRREQPRKKLPRLRSITFEALAAVQVRPGEPGEFANVAILVDPGGVSLDAFTGVVHSLLTWRSRPEFQAANSLAPENAFPVLMFVAANPDRQADFTALWQRTLRTTYSRYDGGGPFLRTLTRLELIERDRGLVPLSEWRWGTERSLKVSLWNGIALARRPSVRPLRANAPWWGNAAVGVAEAARIVGLNYASKGYTSRRGILPRPQEFLEPLSPDAPAENRSGLLKGLVRDHLLVSGMGRWLLDRIGLYPLIRAADLALVLGQDESCLCRTTRDLLARGLVVQPAQAPGYGLTWRGMALLAFQAGFEPGAYAELRGWPVCRDDGGHPRLSLDNWLRQLEHTEITLAFLAGLRRWAPAAGLMLAEWDHTPWPEVFAGEADRPRRLTPDARGVVRTRSGTGPCFETAFWFEVDRSTERGRRLVEKLARYYLVGGPRAGMGGRAERLLIVVERDDEGRLRSLQRRLRELDRHYGARLDVLLTRLDLLDDGRGRLDPMRAVWRDSQDNTFRRAFS